MKDWKQLFGIAAILFGIGFVIRSFQPAYALNGPNVSMGINPIQHYYSTCPFGGNTIFSNNSSSDFIITDVISHWKPDINIQIDAQDILKITGATSDLRNIYFNLRSGIKISAGQTLSCSEKTYSGHVGYPITVSGYYAHP